MAKIVVSTVGTLGDFLPFLALAQGLQARGHEVVLAANPAVLDLAHEAGVPAAPCGPAFGREEARRSPAIPEGATQSWSDFKKWEAIYRDVPGRYRDLSALCRGADLLVAHSLHYAALLVHDQVGLPWVCCSLGPGQFLHEELQPPVQPAPRADLNLLASSLVFSTPQPVIHDYLHVTGFWFADVTRWRPTAPQRRFVEEGDRPLVLCLGGTPGPEAPTLVRLHAEAARRLGKKLVVQGGWADLGDLSLAEDVRPHVLIADFVDHDWLFGRAEAVIHPGGMGVTARALRNGCPLLLEPRNREHYIHVWLLRQLGAGQALDPRKLSVDGLARILAERVATPQTRQQAQQCAERLGAENGVAKACELIEGMPWRAS